MPGRRRVSGQPDLHARVLQQMHHDLLASPLGQWMVEHRHELQAMLGPDVDWGVVAYQFSRAGLRDSTDRKPMAEMAEITWQAVVKEHGG